MFVMPSVRSIVSSCSVNNWKAPSLVIEKRVVLLNSISEMNMFHHVFAFVIQLYHTTLVCCIDVERFCDQNLHRISAIFKEQEVRSFPILSRAAAHKTIPYLHSIHPTNAASASQKELETTMRSQVTSEPRLLVHPEGPRERPVPWCCQGNSLCQPLVKTEIHWHQGRRKVHQDRQSHPPRPCCRRTRAKSAFLARLVRILADPFQRRTVALGHHHVTKYLSLQSV